MLDLPWSGVLVVQQPNVALIGGTGTGKTHLAIVVARSCIRSGMRGRGFNVVDLVNTLKAEIRAGRQGRMADGLCRLDCRAAPAARQGEQFSMLSQVYRTLQPESSHTADTPRASPQIDTGPMERALELMRALNNLGRGALSPSFMGNAAPEGRARTDAGSGRQSSVTNHNNFNVSGYSPAVIARRIVREQQRAAEEARFGALHDLGSLA